MLGNSHGWDIQGMFCLLLSVMRSEYRDVRSICLPLQWIPTAPWAGLWNFMREAEGYILQATLRRKMTKKKKKRRRRRQ